MKFISITNPISGESYELNTLLALDIILQIQVIIIYLKLCERFIWFLGSSISK